MDYYDIPTEQLGLSVRTLNVLMRAGKRTLGDVMACTAEQVAGFRNAGVKTVEEVLQKQEEYRKLIECGKLQGPEGENTSPEETPIDELITQHEFREKAHIYARYHDVPLRNLDLTNRSLNQLSRCGYGKMSDILFINETELIRVPAMGAGSVKNVMDCRRTWLEKHETGLRAAITGDESVLQPPAPDDSELCGAILRLYKASPYAGLSLQDFMEKLPDNASVEQIKKCVGSLLAQNRLEYVDFRCYRKYPRFADELARSSRVGERQRGMVERRLAGDTLETVGSEYGLTRERVRQVTNKVLNVVRMETEERTGSSLFDEDYFLYFYQTFAMEKADAEQWLGISPASLRYLDMVTVRGGSRPLAEAQEDRELSPALRQRVRNYLNRDKLYLDGQWIPKKRADLERYVVEHFCRETVSFSEFCERYNAFLQEQEVPFDEKIYITDAVRNTRRAKMPECRFLLWKQGETLRAYDVDGRDYEELIRGLGLDDLENIELSTQKFVNEYPELLERYDIRDRNELHNLLRKVLADGSFHDLKIERMPNIRFGSFDRDAALFELMVNNAPISQADLAALIQKEYGYDPGITIAGYLQPLSVYYHKGMYTIDQKAMTPARRSVFLSALKDDFYYIDELKQIYVDRFPGADTEEINPYNLKQMGFTVLSRWAVRNHDSLEAYFRDLLTREDLTDITDMRKRFGYVGMFSQALNDLKRSLEVAEYEPNKLISIHRLEAAGISKADIEDFRDAVFDYVEENTFFTAASLRRSGFESELYELGFSDWFYGSLLMSDPRFSFGTFYKAIVLYKGRAEVSVRSFVTSLIRAKGSVDVYDLQREMEEVYGCVVPDRLDLIYKTAGSGVFHDKHMDRLYDSEARYWREVDEAEGR